MIDSLLKKEKNRLNKKDKRGLAPTIIDSDNI